MSYNSGKYNCHYGSLDLGMESNWLLSTKVKKGQSTYYPKDLIYIQILVYDKSSSLKYTYSYLCAEIFENP